MAATTPPGSTSADDAPLLDVRNLRTWFHTERGLFKAVDGISFQVRRGKAVGLVGESGCGKSVTSLSLMGLVPQPPGRVQADALVFDGQDVMGMSAEERRLLRGGRMAMVFQEPMTSLNPVHTIGAQIVEALRAHGDMSYEAAKKRAIEVLELVRIPSAAQRFDDFPHRLSGGMRQRVMIAMALACNPVLLVADEPTTALDVTIQAQVVNLLQDLQKRFGLGYLFIAHDLAVVKHIIDRVAVMYLGKLVEIADKSSLYARPLHPYTQALLSAIPRPEPGLQRQRILLAGDVPSAMHPPSGCRFHTRCPHAQERCRREGPLLRDAGPRHRVACHFFESLPAPEGVVAGDKPQQGRFAVRLAAFEAARRAASPG